MMLPNYYLPIEPLVGPIMSVLRLPFSQTQIMMTMQNTYRHNFPPKSMLKVQRDRKGSCLKY